MKTRTRLHYAALVVLPLLFAAAVAWLQTSNLIKELVSISESASNERSAKLVRSAFDVFRDSLENYALDNSHWDAAATNVSDPINREWIEETWMVNPDDETSFYDGFMLVDGPSRKVLVAFLDGHGDTFDVADVFGQHWTRVVSLLPREADKPGAVSAFLQHHDGPMIVAVAPVVAPDKNLARGIKDKRYFVFVQHLDPLFLRRLGDQYAIEDLRFGTADESDRRAVSVGDDTGTDVVSFSWKTNEAEFAGLWQLWQRSLTILATTILVFAGIALFQWRLLVRVKRNEDMAIHNSLHDHLSGLGNRTNFNQRMAKLGGGGQLDCTVAFADLDGFKGINDRMGHRVGDLLLQHVAGVMRETLGTRGEAYRLGGDEFVMLFPGSNLGTEAEQCAADLLEKLVPPVDLDGRQVRVGVSIGIASSNGDRSSVSDLLSRADGAMYLAKRMGRNRIVVHDSYQSEIEKLHALSVQMKRASGETKVRRYRQASKA